MLIRDATFVVTDTETTGISAGRDRIIELAAVRVRGGEVVDRFSQLVNPGRAVPRRITALTGISTGMVFREPKMEDVMPRYLDFLGDAVFVAHNAGFDQGFLDAELGRLERPPLENPMLCTLRLARRLLAGLRSKSLDSVAAFFGLTRKGHRALADAGVTAEVFLRFLGQIEAEYGIETLDDLLSVQHRTYRRTSNEPKHLHRIRDEVLPQLPERPGVYFMKDRKGDILYIGKAKRLRTRVRSYFNAIEAHNQRLRGLVDSVREVEWEETGSELGALLLESRLIKEHKPRFNRAQVRYRNRPFIHLDTSGPFPRVSSKAYLLDDGAEYFGPLSGRRQADGLVELIDRFFRLRSCDDEMFAQGRRCLYAQMGRCLAPCEGGEGAEAYDAEVQRVRDFLMGRDRAVLDWLEEQMQAAAAQLDYETAGTYRDWLQSLTPLLDRQERIAAPVLDHNAVLVLPGVAGHTVQLLLVRFGRLAHSMILPPTPGPDDLDALRTALATHYDPGLQRPERYHRREVDEVRLLAHWLYTNRESIHHVYWSPAEAPGPFLQRVLATVRELEGVR